MSVTAIVTNHNYGRYLRRCIDSALEFCDEVLVYDDGSTDDSMDILASYGDRIHLTHRDDATGDPVWGSNLGIIEATCTHLLFLDSDNYLVGPPPQNDVDYTFVDLPVVLDDETLIDTWRFVSWPSTARGALLRFIEARGMPFPWAGVWRTSFVRELRWRRWVPETGYAADFRTAVDWCLHGPTLTHDPTPYMVFRDHPGQWSKSPDDVLCGPAITATIERTHQLIVG